MKAKLLLKPLAAVAGTIALCLVVRALPSSPDSGPMPILLRVPAPPALHAWPNRSSGDADPQAGLGSAAQPYYVICQSGCGGGGGGNSNITQWGTQNVVTGGVNGSVGVGGLAASGSAVAGNPVLFGGSDGTNARTVSVDSSGRLVVASLAGALPTGSNTIGAISNTGFNVTGSLPTGTNSIGSVSSTFGQPTTVNLSSTSVNFSSTGDNTLVAGVANQTVRMFQIIVVCSAQTNLTFKDGAGNTLTGPMTCNAGGSLTLDFNGEPWFITSTGNAFILNQSGTAQVSGRVYYKQS